MNVTRKGSFDKKIPFFIAAAIAVVVVSAAIPAVCFGAVGITRIMLCALLLIIVLGAYIVYAVQKKNGFERAAVYFGAKDKNLRAFLIFALVITAVSLILYRDYLFGGKLHVFRDIADDSFAQTLPGFLNQAQNTQNGGLPAWNFSVFTGMSVYTSYNPLDMWAIIFGAENVPWLMGFMQFLKVIGAGCLFYKFLEERGHCVTVCFVGAMAFALCGPMVVRAAWRSYPNEMVLAAFALWMCERLIGKKRNPWLFCAAMALYYISQGLYSSAVFSLGIILYIIIRVSCAGIYKGKALVRLLLFAIAQMAVAAAIGAFTLLPEIMRYTGSARLSGGGDTFVGVLSSPEIIKSVLLRGVSNDIQGGGTNYAGAMNYLEGPALYFGVSLLIMLPSCFVKASKKQKLWYAAIIAAAAVYCLITPVRVALNGFSKDSFKMSSLWIVVTQLLLALSGLEKLLCGKRSKPLLLFAAAVVAAVVVFFAARGGVVSYECAAAALIADGCALLLYLLFSERNKYCVSFLLILLVCAELFASAWDPVNNRINATREDIIFIYGNGAGKIEEELKTDENDIFRMDVPSYFFNDSLAQGYYGVHSYVGGASYSGDTVAFLADTGLKGGEENGYTRVIRGFNGMLPVQSFLGVKYLVYTGNWYGEYAPYGFEKIETSKENLAVYENKYALPIGFVISDYISAEAFDALDTREKQETLLKAAVMDKSDMEALGLTESETQPSAELEALDYDYSIYSQDGELKNSGSENSLALNGYDTLDITLDGGENGVLLEGSFATEAQEFGALTLLIKWYDESGEGRESQTLVFDAVSGTSDVVIPIAASGIKRITIQNAQADECAVSGLKLSGLSAEYWRGYEEDTQKLQQSAFDITEFTQDKLSGSVNAEESGILLLTTTFDDGWKAYIDGKKAEIIKTDTMFMGVYVEAGEHTVTFEYKPRARTLGLAASGAGLLVLALAAFVIPLCKRGKRKK